ncbi:Alanine--tRNA ligase [uncultured archaeon]|nr:Alanine--tRNA ligase [uncultured archaeon]
MKPLTSRQLKQLYLRFFKEKGHAIIPSASLVPENDPTVLFTTAGMHPLVPFLLGQPHPLGRRLANAQKCIRTQDIDEVGDETHTTFFEMMGNWSLGDYFKDEAIGMSHEFLLSKDWLDLDPERLSVTCFVGDGDAPKDEEAAGIWMKLGVPKERIAFLPKKDNWWGPAGSTGPCGPDTEMFYWTPNDIPAPKVFDPKDKRWVEIWNDVFLQYNKNKEGRYEPLRMRNVDTGLGLERVTMILQGKTNIFDIESFKPVIEKIVSLSGQGITEGNRRSFRIIADHMRAATFILGDEKGIAPSNVDQGYILRRYIRRCVRHGRLLGIEEDFCRDVAGIVIDIHKGDYPELEKNKQFVLTELDKEENRFKETLDAGIGFFNKIADGKRAVSGKDAFLLFQSHGFPVEMTKELMQEKGLQISASFDKEFDEEFQRHQELSRLATEKKFKSGLADTQMETIKLHTATHLLHAALKKVLGPDVNQKGSNITVERLRFDFSYDKKVTPEQLKQVEDMVNEAIRKKMTVIREEMTIEEAKAEGATALFAGKYGEKVSVYSAGDFSKEVCTGPHVGNTGELGHFRILKEESVAAGIRRIKAIVAPEPEQKYMSH